MFLTRLNYLVLLLALTTTSISAIAEPIILNRVLAEVNGEPIMASVLEKRYSKWLLETKANLTQGESQSLKKQLLEQLILERAQLQLAKSTGMQVDTIRLDAEIKAIAQANGKTLPEFTNELSAKGLPLAEFKQKLSNNLLIGDLQRRELSSQVMVSSSEVDNFLNSPEGRDRSGNEYQLEHVLIPLSPNPTEHEQQVAIQVAEDIKREADSQATLAKLSMERGLNGNTLSWRKLGAMPKVFIADVARMEVGETRGPIRSESGLHLIKLAAKRQGEENQLIEYQLDHILLKVGSDRSAAEAKTMLTELAAKINSGQQDFKTVAKKHSDEIKSRNTGGELGWINKEQMLPEFHAKITELTPGNLSQPFATSMGWHLVKMNAKRPVAVSKNYHRQQAIAVLQNRKYEAALNAWLRELRSNSNIVIYG